MAYTVQGKSTPAASTVLRTRIELRPASTFHELHRDARLIVFSMHTHITVALIYVQYTFNSRTWPSPVREYAFAQTM